MQGKAFPYIHAVLLASLLISLSSSFQISQSETPLTAQRGNISDSEYQIILKTITSAQEAFDETQYNRIAQNISLTLKVALTGFRWSVFAYAKGVKDVAMSTLNMEKGKYVALIGVGKYALSFQVYGTNSGYGCNQTGGGGSASFGEDLSADDQQKVMAAVNDSVTYRGDNIEGAAMYLANKTTSVFTTSGVFAIIANPTTAFGFYICRYKEKWASLRNYGEFKWNYYLLQL